MTTPFLGVEHSLTGRFWTGPALETERQAEALIQALRLPQPLARVLARIGVDASGVEDYLAPSIRSLLPDPRSLKDMSRAASRFLAALNGKETIAIFADYDVDGGASAALLLDWLHALGHEASLYVPDRVTEGYGPNVPAMCDLAARHDLIICVDCGTLGHEAIAAAEGADVVVLDHHLGGETLPPAYAVVNPNRADETSDLGHLCAAGVVFLFLVEANRQLRQDRASVPDMMAALDLVALATVADVAPLVGVNRAFVRQGLRIMGGRARPGLAALCDAARVDRAPTAFHLGFVLGPRINAGGRIGRADLGARLLACRDAAEAGALAARLDDLNSERREIEDSVHQQAMAQIDARGDDGALAWASGAGWHPGVVGIVASRVKEATGKPAIVIGIDGEIATGSGRSIRGVDLGSIIQRVAAEGLVTRGGGHKMAAGLSLASAGIEAAMARIEALIRSQAGDGAGPRKLPIDGVIFAEAATPELVEDLDRAGPFGAGVPAPRFVLPDMPISFAKEVGKGHLKLRAGRGAAGIEAIAFRALDDPMGQALLNHEGRRFHLAGQLELNHWQGRTSVQLRLEDAALSAV